MDYADYVELIIQNEVINFSSLLKFFDGYYLHSLTIIIPLNIKRKM